MSEQQINEMANIMYPDDEVKRSCFIIGFVSGYNTAKTAQLESDAEPLGENLDDRLMLEEKDTLAKKVMFYREQTQKIRKFIHENNIGKPKQGFFDAILEYLQEQKEKNKQSESDATPERKISTKDIEYFENLLREKEKKISAIQRYLGKANFRLK